MRVTFITVFLTLIFFSVKSQTTSDTRDFSTNYYSHTDEAELLVRQEVGLVYGQTHPGPTKNVGFHTSSVPMNLITVIVLPVPV